MADAVLQHLIENKLCAPPGHKGNYPNSRGTKDQQSKTEGIKIPYGNNIKCLDEDNGYKYLDILQADNNKHTEVKKAAKMNHRNEGDLKVQTQWQK